MATRRTPAIWPHAAVPLEDLGGCTPNRRARSGTVSSSRSAASATFALKFESCCLRGMRAMGASSGIAGTLNSYLRPWS